MNRPDETLCLATACEHVWRDDAAPDLSCNAPIWWSRCVDCGEERERPARSGNLSKEDRWTR